MCIAFRFLLSQARQSFLSLFLLGLVTLGPIPYCYSKYIEYQQQIIHMINCKGGDLSVLFNLVFWYALMRGVHEFCWRIRDGIRIIVSTGCRYNSIMSVFRLIIRNDYAFFDSSKVPAAVANTRQISENAERILAASVKFLSSAIYILTILRLIWQRDVYSFWTLVLSATVYMLIAGALITRAAQNAVIASTAKDRLLAELYNTFMNMPFVFIYKTFDHESSKIKLKAESVRRAEINFENVMLVVWTLQAAVFSWLVWHIVVNLIFHQGRDAAVIIAIIQLINDFVGKMWKAADDVSECVENYGRLHSNLIAVSEPCEALQLQASEPYIKFTGVAFQAEKQLLHYPDLQINRNQSLLIVGASGCGKSTLVDILIGLRSPSIGAVYNGLTQSVGYLPQNPIIFDGTLRYNLTYSLQQQVSDEELRSILPHSIFDFIFKLGLDKSFGNGDFSGGEIQKICLARILVLHHFRPLSLLVADEPTSALDQAAESAIFDILQRLNCAKVIISHKECCLGVGAQKIRLC